MHFRGLFAKQITVTDSKESHSQCTKMWDNELIHKSTLKSSEGQDSFFGGPEARHAATCVWFLLRAHE